MTDTTDINSSVSSAVEEESVSTVKATSPSMGDNIAAQAYSPEDQNNHIAGFEVVDDVDFDVFDNEGIGLGIDKDRFTTRREVKFAIFFLVVFSIFIATSMRLIIKYGSQLATESSNSHHTLSDLSCFMFAFLIVFTSTISYGVAILISAFIQKLIAKKGK